MDGFTVGNDDAFISFRYARNLIEHGVLSFNSGDTPPVEGFSNPLYVAMAAVVYFLTGPDFLYPAMAVLGAVGVAAAIICIGSFGYRRLGPTAAGFLLIGSALCPSLWIHGTSGLETAWVFFAQVMLWTTVATYAERPSGRLSSVILVTTAFMVLLRTDGFVMPLSVALWFLWRGDRRLSLMIAGVCVATFFGLMLARLAYYGLPMPLTYYVKVSGGLSDRILTGARWIAGISIKNGLALPLLGIVLAGLVYLRGILSGQRRQLPAPPLELWLAGILLVYYLYIGGDIYRDRFLLILFPLGTYALLLFLERHTSKFWIASAGLAVLAGQMAAFKFDPRLTYEFEVPKYDRWIELGRFLGSTYPDAVMATGAAGKLPYFSNLHTIDMLGLNDRHIAMSPAQDTIPGHSKFDPAYVLSQKPDIICSHIFTDGNLTYGLNRDVYEAAGYALHYLVISNGHEGKKILELSEVQSASIPELILQGYEYGCVTRMKLDKGLESR